MAGASVEAQADLTPTRRFTITRQTKEIAGRIHSPVRITGFVDPDGSLAVQMRALVRQYRTAHIPVELEVVDPDAQPGRTHAHGVSRYGQMLVELGGRERSEAEYRTLLSEAGFNLTKVVPTEGPLSIVEATPE